MRRLQNNEDKIYYNKILDAMKINCEKCFGFCCVALFFSTSDGFPIDKEAGNPCINLKSDFSCSIHKNLIKNGLKGCVAYDCFGAGQKVAEVTYKGNNWIKEPELEDEMFQVFLIMRQLHEFQWYLIEAISLPSSYPIYLKLDDMIRKTNDITYLSPTYLVSFDIDEHRRNVNELLLKASELIMIKYNKGKKSSSLQKIKLFKRFDYFGADLRKENLQRTNLRGACLIAANLSGSNLSETILLGADMRDTNIKGTNLKHSLFLTQSQINSAIGDIHTKLPINIIRPLHWK